MTDRRERLLFLTAAMVAVAVALFPISTRSTRFTALLLALLLPVLLFRLLRRHPALRLVVLLPVLGGLAALLGPGRGYSRKDLTIRYIVALRSYIGTRYVWGGETALGIDCSGLVRKALVNAALAEGVRTANPMLVRLAAGIWWHDCSALELARTYGGRTANVAAAPAIATMRADFSMPGDLAVTKSGVHVLACVGPSTWIQADPVASRVVVVDRTAQSSWLTQPIILVRWTALTTDN